MMILLDMKKQILSIVLMLCSVGAMAVSLPSTSYSSYSGSSVGNAYTIGAGTTFVNQAMVGSYEGSCNPDSWQSDKNSCKTCCEGELDQCAASCAGDPACMQDCFKQNAECHANCENPELGQPLDAPVYCLMLMVAAYGTVMVYRRRKLA